MDPRDCAQDIYRCALCETAKVHSYCDVCHVNLCKPCVVDHISDGYQKHVIVPFQDRRSTLIYQKCAKHPLKNCKFQCKDCKNIFVCSSCMASEQHRGHIFEEISRVFKKKKQVIEKDTEELDNLISPTYEEIAQDLINQLANLDEGYEKLTATISKQGEQWYREIDFVINKMKTEISEIKVKHKGILQKQLSEIKQTQSLIKQTQLAIKEIKKSTDVSSTIGYNSKIKEFSKLPPKVKVLLPTFIPTPIYREKLYKLFGQITTLTTASTESVFMQNKPNNSVRKLLDEPRVVTTIQTGYRYPRSVVCINEDRVWIIGDTNEIKCLDINNSLLQTIQTISGIFPKDIAVDSDGNVLYSNSETGTVNKVKNGQTEELIRLQGWKPVNLCVTSACNILISIHCDDTAQSKVVRYSGSSKKQTIQFDDEGKPLYSGKGNSKYITENRNHDICVADSEYGAIVVVNQEGKLRWRYSGHPLTTKNKPFIPSGITTDSQSCILTADSNNHCIHILNKNGHFFRYIENCALKYPTGLCVDNNDNLFVCDYLKGNLKKIKYLE